MLFSLQQRYIVSLFINVVFSYFAICVKDACVLPKGKDWLFKAPVLKSIAV